MVNVLFVDVIGIVVPNVPILQVLQRLSPQRVKPVCGGGVFCTFFFSIGRGLKKGMLTTFY